MDIDDLRHYSRRSSQNRRVRERRNNSHEFRLWQWLDYIENSYLILPKPERRSQDRRNEERRLLDRRLQYHFDENHFKKMSFSNVLSKEERKLIEELYSHDID